MRVPKSPLLSVPLLVLLLSTTGWPKSGSDQNSKTTQTQVDEQKAKKSPGAAREIGNGTGNIGAGAARGAGSLAKGTAAGAAGIVTLHPANAGASLAKGAGGAGKDVGVGTAKGSGKILKGTGKALKHIL
jgi:hypothetical protein